MPKATYKPTHTHRRGVNYDLRFYNVEARPHFTVKDTYETTSPPDYIQAGASKLESCNNYNSEIGF